MNNKSKQDIEDIRNSALAAMEAVGLPMEKFMPFQPMAEKPSLLFSNPLKRKLSNALPLSNTAVSREKQKLTG
ncbi:MAG TPA: hypothetical protein VNK03_06395 [Gammaproteobacteria bacterium]|nr:hypothetical protein [Gammaproteobacteria bacterium]